MARGPRFVNNKNEAQQIDLANQRKFCTCPFCRMRITVEGHESCSKMSCPNCGTRMCDFKPFLYTWGK